MTNIQFLKNINKIDKPFVRLIKNKREKCQIPKIRNKIGDIAMNFTEIKQGQKTVV